MKYSPSWVNELPDMLASGGSYVCDWLSNGGRAYQEKYVVDLSRTE